MAKYYAVFTKSNHVLMQFSADTLKEAKSYTQPEFDFYKGLSLKQIGIFIPSEGRAIKFDDLELVTAQELKSTPIKMITALANNDFANDNQTFFMLQRGLVEADRCTLTAKGLDLIKALRM